MLDPGDGPVAGIVVGEDGFGVARGALAVTVFVPGALCGR